MGSDVVDQGTLQSLALEQVREDEQLANAFRINPCLAELALAKVLKKGNNNISLKIIKK
jgi:hypothetical protein